MLADWFPQVQSLAARLPKLAQRAGLLRICSQP
jgi:hypothetical protein